MRRWTSAVALCAVGVVTLCAADQALPPPLIKADADRLEKKLAVIL